MRQTVLVTGGAGYIGSHTCKALAAAGFLPVNYDNLAIACRGVVKRFHLYEQCTRSLRELVIHTLRGKPLNVSRPYFAVSGLDLEVHQGESLAIIGANGSGKSTVLRLIAGVYPPSAGELTTNGRVAAVLELGASFHPELTGMENISLHDRGGTLIIASHDLATVRTLCRKALWMDHGRPRMLGEAGEVIEAYLGFVQRLTLVCSDDLAGMETM
jgi:ABC-type polysaccharide/polyol phosphate transport system ATPase subunit